MLFEYSPTLIDKKTGKKVHPPRKTKITIKPNFLNMTDYGYKTVGTLLKPAIKSILDKYNMDFDSCDIMEQESAKKSLVKCKNKDEKPHIILWNDFDDKEFSSVDVTIQPITFVPLSG